MSKTAHAAPRTLARTLAFALVSIGLGTLLALLLAEGICRILPVSTGVRALPVNASTPTFASSPTVSTRIQRRGTFPSSIVGVPTTKASSTTKITLLATLGHFWP